MTFQIIDRDIPANDNSQNQDWRRCKRLNDDWSQYDRIEMCAFGPIGILNGQGFVYLDPEMNKWRAQ